MKEKRRQRTRRGDPHAFKGYPKEKKKEREEGKEGGRREGGREEGRKVRKKLARVRLQLGLMTLT